MRKNLNVVLTDFIPIENWKVLSGLIANTKESWREISCVSNEPRKNLYVKIKRIVLYFLFPLEIFFKRKQYGTIIAWQQFYGLNFAFFQRLFRTKKVNKLIILTFIYKEKRGVLGSLYSRYINYIVNSKYVDALVCYSSQECGYYKNIFNCSVEKFIYIPLGIEINSNENPCVQTQDKYIFTAGRSNRDYEFLMDALRGSPYKLIIACDELKGSNNDANIIIMNDCFNERMDAYLQNCFCVVVALDKPKISSGQLFILQAMQIGKPIILVCEDEENDYIVNGHTGVIIKKDRSQLLEAIRLLLTNEEIYDTLSKNEIEFYKNNYTLNSLALHISKIFLALNND